MPVTQKATKPKPQSSKSKPAPTKKAVVLGFPSSMTASEVVQQARESGITLSVDSVYSIRSQDRVKKKKTRRSRQPAIAPSTKPATKQTAIKQTLPNGSEGPWRHLYVLAAEVGISRAIEFLQAAHEDAQRLFKH